jgi:large subunit ribosomal protein L17
MRHRKAGRKFGRTTAHREAMLRNMVCNLFEHGRIITTLEKAKEARSLAEKCITYAKKGLAAQAEVEAQLEPLKAEVASLKEKLAAAGDEKAQLDLRSQVDRAGKKIAALQAPVTHYRRLALKRLHHKSIVRELFEEIAPKYTDRAGGYTRVLKAGFRKGDNATKALFELV